MAYGGYSRYGLSQRDRDPLRQRVGQFGRAVPAAGQVAGMVERGWQPSMGYGTLEQPVTGGIKRLIQQPLSPQRYAAGRKRVIKGFGAQTGRLAGAGARRGYTSRAGIATGAAGAPSAALAAGLGQYQVGWEQEQARQLEAGLGAAAQFRQDIAAPRQGYGAFAGEFARMRGGGSYSPGMAQLPGYAQGMAPSMNKRQRYGRY